MDLHGPIAVLRSDAGVIVDGGIVMTEHVKVATRELEEFVKSVLQRSGLSEEDARISAEVLLYADRRCIESHGVARLERYVIELKTGGILPRAEMRVVHETPVSLLVDGGGGMGQPIGYRTMQRCIEKARTNMICLASVRNSNHYGIAGYYTLMALSENMIGISMTNSAPLVVPTHARDAIIGTNPISMGVPAGREQPFLLDMATATVPRGKLEVKARHNQSMPDCWATDEEGLPSTDAARVLDNLKNRRGGGLLPLGGGTEETGGHKGFGLGVAVEILCGVLSSGEVATDVYGRKNQPSGVAHFLGAINPAAFVGLDEIRENMDHLLGLLKSSPKAAGQTRIFVAGEKEYDCQDCTREKLPLERNVFDTLNRVGEPFGLRLSEI
jgi:LDH2 family malate/lactate/ureidoglycolate dehydrogenase